MTQFVWNINIHTFSSSNQDQFFILMVWPNAIFESWYLTTINSIISAIVIPLLVHLVIFSNRFILISVAVNRNPIPEEFTTDKMLHAPCSHTFTPSLTSNGKLESPVHLLVCFLKVEGNQRTWMKHTQTQGEQVKLHTDSKHSSGTLTLWGGNASPCFTMVPPLDIPYK